MVFLLTSPVLIWGRFAMHPLGESRRKVRIAGTLTLSLAFLLSSCGTLLYPERRGQPTGRLDVGVVALDGIGLLVFLVPGVIAFIVDFSTGAIYLPPGYAMVEPPASTDLRRVQVDPAELTPRRVEAVVQEQTGKMVSLEPGAYRAMRLQRIDDFTPEALAGLQDNSRVEKVIFRAIGE
jgi:hypothetical protein